jgi:RecA/RadA recombinase
MINVALSGKIDGGLTPGLTVLAAPSKHFKTAFSLLMAAAFLKAHPDGIILFYDSEFGTPQSYFSSFGVPMESVVHTPITDIEQLKFDVMAQLQELQRNDKVMIIVDSVGNLASKKEVEDALKQSSAADMTRAKQLKSLFRMVTPHLTLKDIPMVVVNHVYMTQEMFSKPVVSGGTGIYYSADNIWIIWRNRKKEFELKQLAAVDVASLSPEERAKHNAELEKWQSKGDSYFKMSRQAAKSCNLISNTCRPCNIVSW